MRGLARHEHNKKMIPLFNDAPAHVDIKQSILDMRSVYKELTPDEFVSFYARRYGVSRNVIAHVLAEDAQKRHQRGDVSTRA